MPNEKRNPNQLPGTYEERVFVGGNYNVAGNLRAIKRYVESAGFVPVFPLDDYKIPEEQIHDWDIRLLHNCKYAIFDVSVPAGELMEIERALTFRTRTLLLFQIKHPGQTAPEQVASMLRTSGHRLQGYKDPSDVSDLGKKVTDFLLEEEDVELYRKAFGYEVDEVYESYEVNKDGSAVNKCEVKGLAGTVSQIHHKFATTLGQIESLTLDGDPSKPMQWGLDEDRSKQPNYKEGHVVLLGGLREGEAPVNYCLTCKLSAGSVCLTSKEIDEQYGGDSLPYETLEREVTSPIKKLVLKVKFFEGYKVIAKPAVFYGQEWLSEVVRPKKDKFDFDDKSNSATFSVTWPKMFHNYIIYWKPTT